MILSFRHLPIIFITLFLLSCQSEKNNIKKSNLNGTWVCIDASIDQDKEAGKLMVRDSVNSGATIEFTETVMKFEQLSDINKPKELNYQLKGNRILFPEAVDLVFEVSDFHENKMTVSFIALERAFEMKLQKK
jgi:hypothetical protein